MYPLIFICNLTPHYTKSNTLAMTLVHKHRISEEMYTKEADTTSDNDMERKEYWTCMYVQRYNQTE